jgi:hypothetical protein
MQPFRQPINSGKRGDAELSEKDLDKATGELR